MSGATAGQRREQLVALYKEVQDCTRCPLHETRTKAVFGAGNADADLMFVGEAPGAEEDRQGLPFVGRAGQLLNQLLEEIGLSREDVFIANVLKSRPPGNRDPQPAEIEACEPYLFEQVRLIEPQGRLHPRQLRHQAAHRQPGRDHPGARDAAGARARRPHRLPAAAVPPGGGAADAGGEGDAARRLRDDPGAARRRALPRRRPSAAEIAAEEAAAEEPPTRRRPPTSSASSAERRGEARSSPTRAAETEAVGARSPSAWGRATWSSSAARSGPARRR